MDVIGQGVRAEVQAGVCGLVTVIEASSSDGMHVTLRVESNCPRVAQAFSVPRNGANEASAAVVAERATGRSGITLDAFQEVLRNPLAETTPARLAAAHGLHSACLVPIAVLRAAEAAANLALPCDCHIKLIRLDDLGEPQAE